MPLTPCRWHAGLRSETSALPGPVLLAAREATGDDEEVRSGRKSHRRSTAVASRATGRFSPQVVPSPLSRPLGLVLSTLPHPATPKHASPIRASSCPGRAPNGAWKSGSDTKTRYEFATKPFVFREFLGGKHKDFSIAKSSSIRN